MTRQTLIIEVPDDINLIPLQRDINHALYQCGGSMVEWHHEDMIDRSDEIETIEAETQTKHLNVPAGVLWDGIEGSEIEREDVLEVPSGREFTFDTKEWRSSRFDALYGGDLGAALAVAEQCDLPFLFYLPDADGQGHWTISAYSTFDAVVAGENREHGDQAALICDTRTEEFVEDDSPAPNGFKAVRLKPGVCTVCKGSKKERVALPELITCRHCHGSGTEPTHCGCGVPIDECAPERCSHPFARAAMYGDG